MPPRHAARPTAPPLERGALLVVAAGGILGSLGRSAVGTLLPHEATGWPWATFLVNLSGCLLMGLLVGTIRRTRHPHHLARPFLGVGVLGGWTTYSAFAVEVVRLLQADAAGLALLYVVASLGLGLAATGLGFALSRREAPAPAPAPAPAGQPAARRRGPVTSP